MLIKGDWVVQTDDGIDSATKRQIRRLKRRAERYPLWLVLGLMGVTYLVALYGSTTSTGTLSLKDYILTVIFAVGATALLYMVVVPESRRVLRDKLRNEWKLYPATRYRVSAGHD